MTEGNSLRLQLGALEGTVDPSLFKWGLHRLSFRGDSVDGKILAVVAGKGGTAREHYTRGGDLVVACESDEPQEFQWQVYWRAASPSNDITQVDAIVSLQTPLLECFPSFSTYSHIQATEAWGFSAGDQPRRLEIQQQFDEPQSELHGIVLRDEQMPWSYLELSQPVDEAQASLACSQDGIRILRNIGGKFLEKGVIRRMRIRGIFLPREDDLETAEELYAAFSNEGPPLTT